MSETSSRAPHPAFFGLALITVGFLFLLRELDVLPDIRVWTLVWLGLGGWMFVGTLVGRRKGWFWPLTLIAIGGFMLFQDLEYIDRDFSLWPVIVIAVGLSIVLEAIDAGRRSNGDDKPAWQRFEDL